MLRTLVLVLLLANVLFFAWARGWLGTPPRQGQSEPARLAAQVRPELLKVLPAPAANVAVQAVRAAGMLCLETGLLASTDLTAAEALLVATQMPEGSWMRTEPAALPSWLVYIGRLRDPAVRRAREEDLRRLDLSVEALTAPPELAPGFVLSRHATRNEAQAWLNALPAPALRGVRGVRVVQLPGPAAGVRLRVALAPAELADRLMALPPEGLAGGFKPCAVRP